MASIEQRSNGSVRVLWRHDKRQQRITVDGIKDARMLVRWLDRFGTCPSDDPALLRAIGRAPKVTALPDLVTVDEALRAWENRDHVGTGRARRPMAASSRRTYGHQRAMFAALHDVPVQRLTQDDIDRTVADLRGQGYSHNAVTNACSTLAGALRPHGMAELLAGHAGAPGPADRQREPYALERDQIERLVKIGHDYGLGDAIALAAATGARFGELRALRRENGEGLAGSQPRLFICQQILKDGTVTDRLKTRTSRRRVPISRDMASWVADQPAGWLAPHFRNRANPWPATTLDNRLRKVSAEAMRQGVTDRAVHWHDFRHSFGANLLASNQVDLVPVSQWMGHASPGITGTTYGHITQQAWQGVYAWLG